MIIEKRNKEIIIRIPETVDTEEIQDFVDYIRYQCCPVKLFQN